VETDQSRGVRCPHLSARGLTGVGEQRLSEMVEQWHNLKTCPAVKRPRAVENIVRKTKSKPQMVVTEERKTWLLLTHAQQERLTNKLSSQDLRQTLGQEPTTRIILCSSETKAPRSCGRTEKAHEKMGTRKDNISIEIKQYSHTNRCQWF
jgi:hypothetical protein